MIHRHPKTIVTIVFFSCVVILTGYFFTKINYLRGNDPQQTVLTRVCGKTLDQWTKLSSISPALKRAVVINEDPRFYEHYGIDLYTMAYSLKKNIEEKKIVRGGSTISMQVAKNLFLFPKLSWLGKIAQIFLGIMIDIALPKDRILEIYLNIAEWGDCVFGINSASELYFHVKPLELNAMESAFLASILPNPKLMDTPPYSGKFSVNRVLIYYKLRGEGFE